MERGTRFFWGLIAALLGASLFYGLNAESRRRAVQGQSALPESGELVTVAQVIDGDTMVVTRESGDPVGSRLLGIKAFARDSKDPTAIWGKLAQDALARRVAGKTVRVLVGTPPKDKHGRALVEVFADDVNVGQELVAEGLALVYTVYAFPAMPLYLEEQAAARAAHKGLWGDASVAERADRLARGWARRASE